MSRPQEQPAAMRRTNPCWRCKHDRRKCERTTPSASCQRCSRSGRSCGGDSGRKPSPPGVELALNARRIRPSKGLKKPHPADIPESKYAIYDGPWPPKLAKIEIRLRGKRRYRPQPRGERPLSWLPEGDEDDESPNYIIRKVVSPPEKPMTPELAGTLCYILGNRGLAGARFAVKCTEALQYVSPQELENWEYQDFLRREKEQLEKREVSTHGRSGRHRKYREPSIEAPPDDTLVTPIKRRLIDFMSVGMKTDGAEHFAGEDVGDMDEMDDNMAPHADADVALMDVEAGLGGDDDPLPDAELERKITQTLVSRHSFPSQAFPTNDKILHSRIKPPPTITGRSINTMTAQPLHLLLAQGSPARTPSVAKISERGCRAMSRSMSRSTLSTPQGSRPTSRKLPTETRQIPGNNVQSRVLQPQSNPRCASQTTPAPAPQVPEPSSTPPTLHPMFIQAVNSGSNPKISSSCAIMNVRKEAPSLLVSPPPSSVRPKQLPQPRSVIGHLRHADKFAAQQTRGLFSEIPLASSRKAAGPKLKPKKPRIKTPAKKIVNRDESYEVKKLLSDKWEYNERGDYLHLYRVLWEGNWPPDQNPTWEPESHINAAMLKQYQEEKVSGKQRKLTGMMCGKRTSDVSEAFMVPLGEEGEIFGGEAEVEFELSGQTVAGADEDERLVAMEDEGEENLAKKSAVEGFERRVSAYSFGR